MSAFEGMRTPSVPSRAVGFAHLSGTSSPKRPYLGQIGICIHCRSHGGFDARIFAPSQKTGGKDAVFIGASLTDAQCRDAFFMHGDVIKIAKPVLQALEGG